jgi:hypothetical protein
MLVMSRKFEKDFVPFAGDPMSKELVNKGDAAAALRSLSCLITVREKDEKKLVIFLNNWPENGAANRKKTRNNCYEKEDYVCSWLGMVSCLSPSFSS